MRGGTRLKKKIQDDILSPSGKKLVQIDDTATERSKQLISTKEMQSRLVISACYLEFPANSC